MPLRKAPLPIQFAGGVDTFTDPKQVPTTQLLDLQNAVWSGRSSIGKRNGYRALSRLVDGAGTEYGTPRGLAERDDELLLFDGSKAYSYRESSNTWDSTGEVASVVASGRPHARTGTQQWCPDMAARHGVMVTAWEDSRGGVWCTVTEEDSGRILLAQTQLDASSNAIHPRCVECGQVLLVLFARKDLGQLKVAVINPAAPTVTPVASVLTNDLSLTNPVFDAEATLGGVDATLTSVGWTQMRPAAITWALNGGGFRVGYLSETGVLGSPLTGLPSVVTYTDTLSGPIAIAVDKLASTGNPVAVLWGDSTVIRCRHVSPYDFGAVRGPVAVSGAASGFTRLTGAFGKISPDGFLPILYWAADDNNARTDQQSVIVGSSLVDDPSLDGITQTLLGHSLVTRAFRDGSTLVTAGAGGTEVFDGEVYVTVTNGARFFPYAAVVRISAPVIGGSSTACVARLLPGESAGAHFRRASPSALEYVRHLPSVIERGIPDSQIATHQHRMPLSYRVQLDSTNGDQFGETAIVDMTLDFDSTNAYQTAQLGRNLYLAGALPLAYDGDRWTEADYHCAPDLGFQSDGTPVQLSASFTPSVGGGSMSNGTYFYKLWYEDVDALGELHPGPTSVGVFITLSGGGSAQKVTITAPTYRLTNKRRVRLCVARSKAGATGTDAEIPLFRCTGLDPAVTTGNNCYVANDPTVNTLTFVDALDDATLGTREPLYTNGGIISNDPAPWSGAAIATGKARLFWLDPSDPQLVRFSQTIKDITGLEAPTDLSLRVDPYGGDAVAVATMDDRVYVFCETAIYRFAGPGPQANPEADANAFAFSSAELVTADVGCNAPGAIAQTPAGLMFPTSKGIRLLTREGQIVPIGDPVDAYSEQTFRRATLIPDRSHVVFLTDEGRSLLFDYRVGQWSTFTNHEGVDAIVVAGRYYYLRNDGRVFVETPGEYRDDNVHIPMRIETAWIKMAGYLQGWQRALWVYFLGTHKSSHTLVVNYRIDYEEAWSVDYLLDVDSNYSPSEYGGSAYGNSAYGGIGGPSTTYQRRIHLNKRCQSIQFRIEDRESTDAYGASFELSELLLIGGVLGAAFPVGPGRSG